MLETPVKYLSTQTCNSSTETVKNQIRQVEMEIHDCNLEMDQYKKSIEELRQDLYNLDTKITKQYESIPKSIDPEIFRIEQTIKQFYEQQNSENLKLQKQITAIKKEKSELQQLIVHSNMKMKKLEDSVGVAQKRQN